MALFNLNFINGLRKEVYQLFNRKDLRSVELEAQYERISGILRNYTKGSLKGEQGKALDQLMQENQKLKSLYILSKKIEAYRAGSSSQENAQVLVKLIDVFVEHAGLPPYILKARKEIGLKFLKRRRLSQPNQSLLEAQILQLEKNLIHYEIKEAKLYEKTKTVFRLQVKQLIDKIITFVMTQRQIIGLDSVSALTSRITDLVVFKQNNPSHNFSIINKIRKLIVAFNYSSGLGSKKKQINDLFSRSELYTSLKLKAFELNNVENKINEIKRAIMDIQVELTVIKATKIRHVGLLKPFETKRKKIKKTSSLRPEDHDDELIKNQIFLETMHDYGYTTTTSITGSDDSWKSSVLIDRLKKLMLEVDQLRLSSISDKLEIKILMQDSHKIIDDVVKHNAAIIKLKTMETPPPSSIININIIAEKTEKLRKLFKKRQEKLTEFGSLLKDIPSSFSFLIHDAFVERLHSDVKALFMRMQREKNMNYVFFRSDFDIYIELFYKRFKKDVEARVVDRYRHMNVLLEIYASSIRLIDQEEIMKISTKLSGILFEAGIRKYFSKPTEDLKKWMAKVTEIRRLREKITMIVKQQGTIAMLYFIGNQNNFANVKDMTYMGWSMRMKTNVHILIAVALEFNHHFKELDLNLLLSAAAATEDEGIFGTDKVKLMWRFVNQMVKSVPYLSDFPKGLDINLILSPVADLIIKWALNVEFKEKIEPMPSGTIRHPFKYAISHGIVPKNVGKKNEDSWAKFLMFFIKQHTADTDQSLTVLNHDNSYYNTFHPDAIIRIRRAGLDISGYAVAENPIQSRPASQVLIEKFKNDLLAMVALGFLRLGFLSAMDLFRLPLLWVMLNLFVPDRQNESIKWIKTTIQKLGWLIVNQLKNREHRDTLDKITDLEFNLAHLKRKVAQSIQGIKEIDQMIIAKRGVIQVLQMKLKKTAKGSKREMELKLEIKSLAKTTKLEKKIKFTSQRAHEASSEIDMLNVQSEIAKTTIFESVNKIKIEESKIGLLKAKIPSDATWIRNLIRNGVIKVDAKNTSKLSHQKLEQLSELLYWDSDLEQPEEEKPSFGFRYFKEELLREEDSDDDDNDDDDDDPMMLIDEKWISAEEHLRNKLRHMALTHHKDSISRNRHRHHQT